MSWDFFSLCVFSVKKIALEDFTFKSYFLEILFRITYASIRA